jgi:hypothetical protein
MKKEELKNKQIEIFNDEVALANKTQKVLVEILEHMSEEELEKLTGTELDIYKEIVSIDGKGLVYVDTDVDEEFACSLEELSQIQQKEIIDTVLCNIWGL